MAELKLKADSGGGTSSLKGPASSGASPSWRLPSADGSSGQYLKTDGSGVMSWATVASPVTALNNATANELVTVGSTTTELDAEANLTFDGTDLTLGTGNLVVGTSGKGIDFSATADSGTTHVSSLLDDYEEGTWTPVLQYHDGGFQNSNITVAGSKTGTYTKVGNMVHFTLKWTNFKHDSGGDGFAKITGLPYSSGEKGSILMTYTNAFTSGTEDAHGMVSAGAIEFYRGQSWLLWVANTAGMNLYGAGTYSS